MSKGLLRSNIVAAFDKALWEALQTEPISFELKDTVQPSLILGLKKDSQGSPALPAAITAEKDDDGNYVLLTKIVNLQYHPHQDVRTTAGPTFAGLTLTQDLDMNSNNITGIVSMELSRDITMTGGVDTDFIISNGATTWYSIEPQAGGNIDIDVPIGDLTFKTSDIIFQKSGYEWSKRFDGYYIALTPTATGHFSFDMFNNPGTKAGAKSTFFTCWAVATKESYTPGEYIQFKADNANNEMRIISGSIGAGTTRPIVMFTGSDTNQFCIATNGRIGIQNTSPSYTLDVTGEINATTRYRINGTAGASGTFTTADVPAKTVTVTNGIVTGIV